jgi:hypothetical protein
MIFVVDLDRSVVLGSNSDAGHAHSSLTESPNPYAGSLRVEQPRRAREIPSRLPGLGSSGG